jgi:uncharacterized protein YoaH (UPF0181 family)
MSHPGWHELSDAERALADRALNDRLEELSWRVLLGQGHDWDSDVRKAVALLRHDPPPQFWDSEIGALFRQQVSDMLEWAYLPSSRHEKQQRERRRQAKASAYRGLISALAEREGISQARALERVARRVRKKPETLRKFLKRNRDKSF